MLALGDLLGELELELLAGGSGAGRGIRSVHSSELVDPTPWMSGGELLLTTGQNLLDPYAQRDFVARLDEAGLAGCGLGVGFDHGVVPAAMLEAARDRDFPLFEVPYEMPFIAITEAAFKELVQPGYSALERSIDLHARLEDLVLGQRGAGEILATIAEAISGTAMLVDAGGEVVERRSDAKPPRKRDLAALCEQIAARSAGSRYASFEPEGPLARRVIVQPVPAHGAATRVWLALIRSGDPGEFERLVARQGGVVIALEMMRERAVRETERRLAGDVLAEALGGRLEPDELLARLRPFSLEAEIAVLVFEVDEPDAAEAQLAEALAGAVTASLSAVTTAAGRPLLCAVVDAAGDDPVEIARSVRGELALAHPEARAAASRGMAITSLRRAFHEARCALEATAFGNGERPEVASHEDLGAFTLLLSLQDEDALRTYADSLLAPIADADQGYGPELLRSLETFIEQNGHWERAAKLLYCHRHTLRYRIRKVEELTGRDLARAHDRIELWLALRARELVR